MPVQSLNCFQDFCRESDSGLMIDANIVTVVPLWPAYAWYWAQSPVSVGTAPAPLLLFDEFEQPAAAVAIAMAGTSAANTRRRLPMVMALSSDDRWGAHASAPSGCRDRSAGQPVQR